MVALVIAECGTYEGGPPAGMILIPGGWFQMGDPFNEGDPDERPVHTVVVEPLYMDVYEVTNEQYQRFDPDASSSDSVSTHPVEGVSWYDAVRYCNWRSRREGLHPCYDETTWACDFGQNGYRLPTEVEWEYAARGGLEGKRYPWGNDISHDKANYYGTGGKDRWKGTAPVGSFPPNGFGVYDMAGNVWEWCTDGYKARYYSEAQEGHQEGPQTGIYRVRRGGAWNSDPYALRCAFRVWQDPTDGSGMGFRCVRRVP